MTDVEVSEFERFLHQVFSEGSTAWELRLSDNERDYVQKKYPRIKLELIANDGSPDEKLWYKASICSQK